MSDMAKQARAAMKAKAKSLTSADPHQKVDSSTWSPPEALNTTAKTGMRPISRRAFKSGGKVEGQKAKCNMGRAPRKSGGSAEAKQWMNAKINRNVKDANEEREGIKHIGGMKKGGRAKKAIGGAFGEYLSPALMAINALRGDKDEKKHGGRTKYADRGFVDYGVQGRGTMTKDGQDVVPARSKHMSPIQQRVESATVRKMPTESMDETISKMQGTKAGAERALGLRPDEVPDNYKKGGRTKKMLGGPLMQPDGMMSAVSNAGGAQAPGGIDPNDPRLKMVSPQAMNFGQGAKGTPYKRGGAAKHPDEAMDKALFRKMEKAEHKKEGHEDEAMDKALIRKMVKPEARTKRKEGGGVFSGPSYPGKIPGVVPGGRTAKAAGGQTTTTKGKGKTNIRINIMSAPPVGGGDMLSPRMGPTPPPGAGGAGGGRPIPIPAQPGGAGGGAPMPIPVPIPMGGMPGGGAGGMPPGRKAGGRVAKIAKSYKDMEAGAGGGEGRLQKTDIAKKHKDAPAFRRGGKAYRSYKDMDAGAGSGMGRLEKTEIQARKG